MLFVSFFYSRSSGRKPYKYGNHGHKHYQRKGLFGKLADVLNSGSYSYNRYPHRHEYEPSQERPNSQVMTCRRCHVQIPAGSKFCLECGEKVEKMLFCMNCGETLPAGAKFCSNCGAKTNN